MIRKMLDTIVTRMVEEFKAFLQKKGQIQNF